MKICLRYPPPKSSSSGGGLAIAALKVFLCQMFWFISTLAVLTAHYASCTINHAKIKIFANYYIVITIWINYFKNRTKTWCFVHPEPHSYPTPSTFRAIFVDGTVHQPPPVHVLTPFCGRHRNGRSGVEQ